MKHHGIFTKTYLHECFTYSNGKIFWKARPKEHFPTEHGWKVFSARFSGKEAGSKNGAPSRSVRWQVFMGGYTLKRHHIVWIMHGKKLVKTREIGYINSDSLDDRIENLRIATHFEHMANSKLSKRNTSGYKGVSWSKAAHKWIARIRVNGKNINLGLFSDLEEAHVAYVTAAKSASTSLLTYKD